MGGLRHEMPWTYRTFLVGTLAIAGIPGLSGFFSKDAVLWAAWNFADYGKVLWGFGVVTTGFTSFYMFRVLILTFHGSPRYTRENAAHVHEPPSSMLIPLLVLAVLAIVAGYVGVPPIIGGSNTIQQFLTPAGHEAESESLGSSSIEAILMATSTATALLGLALAYVFYVARPELPERLAIKFHALYSIVFNKYYVDQLYDMFIVWPVVAVSREFFWKVVDSLMIDGAVNGVGYVVRGVGAGLRYMQTGYVRTYACWILFGGVLIMAWFLK